MSNRISFFIGSMHGGGAEKVISILANHYIKMGWEVDIVLLLDTNVGYELDKGIKIIDLSQSDGSYYKRLPKWLINIRSYVKKRNPDRIVSFVGRINVLVLTACIGINIPIIVSERNDPKHDGRSALMLMACNYSYRRAKAVVYQTMYEKGCFSSKLNNGVVIANPVMVSISPKPLERPFDIVTAGRLNAQKNQKLLIEAVSQINNPKIVLKIYGDGELKEELQTEAVNQGVNAEFYGNVSDLHERINGAGIFVLCSNYEGLSNALIEAMMLGLVCISTDYPGSDELIVDGKNGIIVPRGDPAKLAEAIMQVYSDNTLRNSLSQCALTSSEKYKKEYILKQWENVIGR